MRVDRKFGTGRAQAGSALLIAIFALLLISVVGIALLLSTGTDTALAGNYRTSTAAYYAAVAGLEEARGRLMLNNPDFLNRGNAYPGLFTAGAPTFGTSDVIYILNPVNGETVNPTDLSNPATYPDTEYVSEFPSGLGSATVRTIPSVSSSPLANPPLPGPLFKWVRINAISEQSLKMDVDGDHDATSTVPLYYNGNGLNVSSTGNQALELTALAVLPTGSTKILQYVVAAPAIVSPVVGVNFPSALTLIGNNVFFQGPSAGFVISGQDQINMTGCTASGSLADAIGYTNSAPGDTSRANILAGATPPSNYQGAPLLPGPPQAPSTQSIGDVSASLPANWQTVSGLQQIVQNITNNADVVINGNATGNQISALAAAAVAGQNSGPNPNPARTPMTIVVNGNLDLNAWHNTGYGLLLVTGTLYYDPDASWEGIVLVIGQGNFVSSSVGNGGIDGEVVVAQTLDRSGNLLSSLGSASYRQTGGNNSGRGINYSSCLVQSAQSVLPYKVLSFREIPQ